MNAMWPVVLICSVSFVSLCVAGEGTDRPKPKQASALFPAELVANARENAAKYDWAKTVHDRIVKSAQPWRKLSHDELWDLMFGATIERSWMVWSGGHCPSCKKGVPMYTWEIDPFARPWKVRCPHCKTLFPKNDFGKFHQSGLDEHGVFNEKLADRSLLFNVEHPNADDPMHKFGVDDGYGYKDGKKRWWFIGTYLIYGQWKHAIVDGIRRLADAYVVTGDREYARRAGILLDRVADLYPTFDFGKQGIVYERRGDRGYVSTWHDACEEVRFIALAYDQVFEALRDDAELVEFLSAKAKRYKLDNPKASFADIQRNIEDRILRDTLRNAGKIASNYPRTPVTLTAIKAVLGWPENREEVNKLVDGILKRSTAVDGMTGEKGLAGYSTIGPRALATFLGRLARLEPRFLADVYKRHPRLHLTFRFHVDTYCLGAYYPQSGDTGYFAGQVDHYCGAEFNRPGSIEPSAFAFFWHLYELTKDPAFVQVLHRTNEGKVDGLPYDILATNPEAFQKSVADVIAREGETVKLGSVNKRQWHIAILRSGQGKHRRSAWLDYDSGGGHSHADGMNLGLFAKGLDLMPDFGYPPVQYGGWKGDRFSWYVVTASHNTVTIDGARQPRANGKTTLWADGERFRAIRTTAPGMVPGKGVKQYERTAAMVDVDDDDAYVIDVFRVIGGKDHAKFMHSHFGQIATTGLSLEPGKPYGHGTQMRNFQTDPAPKPGWRVDWTAEDRYEYLPKGAQVHLGYTDLTTDASASTAEAWVIMGIYNSMAETWVPRIMIRRQADAAPLASTFVGVIEPYGKRSNIAKVRRLPLATASGQAYPDTNVAVEIALTDGRRDLVIAADVENPRKLTPSRAADGVLVQKDWQVRLDGELCMIRRDQAGRIRRIALSRGKSVKIGDAVLTLRRADASAEVVFDGEGKATVVSGAEQALEDVRAGGKSALRR